MIAKAAFLSRNADVEEAFVGASPPSEPPRGMPRLGRPDKTDSQVTTDHPRLMKKPRRA